MKKHLENIIPFGKKRKKYDNDVKSQDPEKIYRNFLKIVKEITDSFVVDDSSKGSEKRQLLEGE